MSGERVEFFYDLSSPWTYIAFHNLDALIARTGVSVRLRPILVGGVFNAVNPSVYAAREAADNPKFKHSWRVMRDWAKLAGVEINFPSIYHPAKSIHAMRMACSLADDQVALKTFSKAAFESYFGAQDNLDEEAMRTAAQSDAVKALLRANTDEVIARGGYGSPTIFVDTDKMYFGNDQLPLVEFALNRSEA
jgi:2-hydroxychromene-2-carboxylate isomerase